MYFKIWIFFKWRQDIYIHFLHIRHSEPLLNYFSQTFPVIFSGWQTYSFPVTFIYERLNFWCSLRFFFSISSRFNVTVAAYLKHFSLSLVGFIVVFLIFYPICRIYIWSTTIQTYFLTFLRQKLNTNKDKITTFHWCFKPNLISRKKWFKRLSNILICFIINQDFYVINLWMHYTFFIIAFWRTIVNCHC